MKIRPVRAIFSISVVVATMWAVANSAITTPSIDAVVNAEVTVVRSLVEGVVEGGPPRIGTIIEAGERVALVKGALVDQSFLGELRTEHLSLEARQTSLNEEISSLLALRNDLIERIERYKKSMTKALEHEILGGEAERASTEANLNRAVSELDRAEKLYESDVVSKKQLEDAHFTVEDLKGQIQAKSAGIEFNRTRRDAIATGSFLGGGHNDVPYSQQRLDELELRLTDLRALRTEHAHRADAISQQIQVETERLNDRQEFAVMSPLNGIVWRRLTKPDSAVVIGTEIAEIASCEKTFIDVVIDEKELAKISIGQKASAKFVGADRFWTATVRSMRGAGAVTADRLLAAKPKDRGPQEAQVILDFNAADLGAGADNFCHIGRNVELIFNVDTNVFGVVLAAIKGALEKARLGVATGGQA
ncbi:MAG: HlyD family secretion protein [Rhodospirillales bacterium]|nr:HlyD family secretion protein [Rhodospirillales bacterium]